MTWSVIDYKRSSACKRLVKFIGKVNFGSTGWCSIRASFGEVTVGGKGTSFMGSFIGSS